MATKRTQTVALIALLAVLAAVLWYQWRTPAVAPSAASYDQSARASTGTTGQRAAPPAVAQVKLDDLLAPRPAPGDGDRNPFRFKPKPPPAPPPAPPVVAPPTTMMEAPPVPTGPPPPPPIRVKFIGVVEQEGKGKIAVLSEPGNVFYGVEGQIADGRFLIIKIGVESIEMSYPDGRGRTTIRLSGS